MTPKDENNNAIIIGALIGSGLAGVLIGAWEHMVFITVLGFVNIGFGLQRLYMFKKIKGLAD
jgi:hypothetical protein